MQQASKLNDLTKEEEEGKKKARCRGEREQLGGKGRGGTSPEAYVESRTDCIAKGLAEVLQPYSKNLSDDGPGVPVAFSLKLWSSRRSLTSVL